MVIVDNNRMVWCYATRQFSCIFIKMYYTLHLAMSFTAPNIKNSQTFSSEIV